MIFIDTGKTKSDVTLKHSSHVDNITEINRCGQKFLTFRLSENVDSNYDPGLSRYFNSVPDTGSRSSKKVNFSGETFDEKLQIWFVIC